jgi:adenylate cyclase
VAAGGAGAAAGDAGDRISQQCIARTDCAPCARVPPRSERSRPASAKPAAVAIDVLFAEPDSRSPAALARQLGAQTGRPELAQLAESLPDGDKRLAQAARDLPVAFGFVLDPDQSQTLPVVPVLIRGAPALGPLWRAAGAVGPHPPLMEAGRGMSLPGDPDGEVRRVPLLVAVGDRLRPGLAAEAVRLARQASSYLVESDPLRLTMGNVSIPLSEDALLRLAPPGTERPAAATHSAVAVLAGDLDARRFSGAIVLIGGSAFAATTPTRGQPSGVGPNTEAGPNQWNWAPSM